MSRPLTGFSAKGGELRIGLGNRPVGQLMVVPGTDLAGIVERINHPAAGFEARGIVATLRAVGTLQAIELGGGEGLPLQVSGTMVGPDPHTLQFTLNPRDALGMTPPPDLSVPGFANFFGLNDVFVAEPSSAFDAKVPPGLFNSNAAPGTAQALTLNPWIRDNPDNLGDWSTLCQMSDLLNSPMNIAAAGELGRGNQTLADYAESIVEWAMIRASASNADLAFKQVLLDQLKNQKKLLPTLTITDRLDNLAAFQQAHEDSLRLLSSMPKLLDSLGLHVH